MTDIIDSGIAYRIQHSQRADGQWFRRTQWLTQYGYKWSAWKATNIAPDHRSVSRTAGKARLPK